MVLRGVGWDKKELLKSNLHVYGRDNTKIVIYSTGRQSKRGIGKKNQEIFVRIQ